MLRTLNYHKRKSNLYVNIPFISSGFFETRSTMKTINDHHLFYVNETDLRIYITPERPTVTWSSPLFQQIEYVKVGMPIIRSSLWNSLLDLGKNNVFIFNLFSQNNLPFFLPMAAFVRIIFNFILLVNFRATNDDDDARESVTCLSQFVHLPNITAIEFGSTLNMYRWKHIQFILQ